MAKNIFCIEIWLLALIAIAAASDCDIGKVHMEKVLQAEEEYIERLRRDTSLVHTSPSRNVKWIDVVGEPMPIVLFEEEVRMRRESEEISGPGSGVLAPGGVTVPFGGGDDSRSSGNPDPGTPAVTDFIPEMMVPVGECENTADVYGFPDCMPWRVYNGKILFRLSSYDYTRSRANDACVAMGGWLAIAQNAQDHQYINDFLDEAIGEPTILADTGGLGGADSWFAPVASDQTIGEEIVKMWFGQQCDPAGFHLCESFKDNDASGFWDDCDDPNCNTCNSYCPVVPTYTWNGFPPSDSAEPNCMELKPLQNPLIPFASYEYYWHEANCDRQIAALCEIDLKEVGCFAFGLSAITSPKWKVSCIQYEWCDEGTIVMGTCPEGTFFDQYAEVPDCYDVTTVEDCDVDECFEQTHNCHTHGLCTNVVGSYECSCPGLFDEYQAGEDDGEGTTYANHTCIDINECDDPSLFECVVNSGCNNLNGSYECVCDQWLAPLDLDDDGNPTECVDDDECTRPYSCGPNAVCANRDLGYYCSCAQGYYDSEHELEQGAWDRIDNGTYASGPNSAYIPMNGTHPVIGNETVCDNADECEHNRYDCDMNMLNVCEDTDGSYACVCAAGSRFVNQTISNECKDIDQCDEYTFVCDPNAACVNDIMDLFKLMAGQTVTYHCECRPGLNNTGYDEVFGYDRCDDVDECNEGGEWEDVCGLYATCTNDYPYYDPETDTQNVPYMCSCPQGFIVNTTASDMPFFANYTPHDEQFVFECEDRDECSPEYNVFFCQPGLSDFCDNTIGSYNCGCREGFVNMGGGGCGDGNECADQGIEMTCSGVNPDCVWGEDCVQCVNTMGSYQCGCNTGWDYIGEWSDTGRLNPIASPDCTDCDLWDVEVEGKNCTLCGPICVNWNECLNGQSSCGVGWTLTDILSGPDVNCTDTTGSYYCGCPAGYYTADNNVFENPGRDIYPPITGQLSPNGTYDKKCYDIDECAFDQCTQEHQLCYNNPGAYDCLCANGYEPETICMWEGLANQTCLEICIDIDECERDYPCVETFTGSDSCTNTDGSYYCDCGGGYIMNWNVTYNETHGDDLNTLYDVINYNACEDFNECDYYTYYCDVNAHCNNTDGSYVCWCDPEIYIDVNGTGILCTDLDECDVGNGCNITSGSECTNFFGGYECGCLTGYREVYNWTGLPFAQCEDIPECEENLDTCVDEAHDDLDSFPETLEEPYCTNSSDIESLNRCGLKASCTNTAGSYECACNYPYIGNGQGTGVGTGCNYPRECATGAHECPTAEYWTENYPDTTFDNDPVECNELPYFYQCRCTTGFFPLPDGHNCATYNFSDYLEQQPDYAENAKDLWCDSFNYTFGGDGVVNNTVVHYACIDIDECSSAFLDFCAANSNCYNTVGSHECECMDGYEGDARVDGTSCSDINECETGGHSCPTDDGAGRCENIEGFYECYCNDGYKDDSPGRNATICIDCDECTDELHNCDGNAECGNNIGSYDCTCNTGYTGDGEAGTCNDEDECTMQTHDCHNFAACANTVGSFECLCMQGFTGDGRTLNESFVGCVDEDECTGETHNCDGLAVCTNIDGSYLCECVEGYLGDGLNHTDCDTDVDHCCKDMDECGTIVNICGLLANCTNTVGSYNCTCEQQEGYRLSDDGYDCTDIDECDAATCADYDACPICDSALGVCSNTHGNYSCSCQHGYNGTGYGENSCMEIDQCDFPGLFTCPFNATCVELTFAEDDYRCDCNEGYEKVNVYCRDVDECAEKLDDCDTQADCINTDGAYYCSCQQGYVGDGTLGNCTNDDECTAATHNCNQNATCTDNVGSFSCGCNTGFFGNGDNCYDVDECQDSGHNCCTVAGCVCVNHEGYHSCECEDGYDGDGFLVSFGGRSCANLDECVDDNHNCDTDNGAICTDVQGGFGCSCPGNFEGDGIVVEDGGEGCIDVDECRFCADGSEPNPDECPCSPAADCTNEPNTYSCECQDGYEGDGTTCIDTNECAEELDNCGENSVCTNLEPGFQCDCEEGYSGDGETCEDIDECVVDLCPNIFANTECENSEGSFACECVEGYVDVSGDCLDIDECFEEAGSPDLHQCPGDSACDNTDGSYVCECDEGFSGTFVDVDTFTCENIDECTEGLGGRKRRSGEDACPEHSDCVDSVGSFACNCHDGYEESADVTACIDTDECLTCFDGSTNCVCGTNTECTNTEGSFTCACLEGYELNANDHDCDDTDECSDPNAFACGDHATCVNIPASYECDCDAGYENNQAGDLCVDVNECVSCDSEPRDYANCPCDHRAFCVNTDGSHECWCPLGWMMDEEDCVDVDECDAVEYLDAQDEWLLAEAANLTGDFHDPMSDSRKRRDANHPDAACSGTENCVNTVGTYVCDCIDGFRRDGVDAEGNWINMNGANTDGDCIDMDECQMSGMCPSLGSTCANNAGSFDCTCNAGFVAVEFNGIVQQCADVNECTQNAGQCGAHSICSNTFGGFQCHCLAGFREENEVCVDKDECAEETHLCQSGGFPLDCVNVEGTYECRVPPGLSVDGKQILDWLVQLAEEIRNGTGTTAAPATTTDGGFIIFGTTTDASQATDPPATAATQGPQTTVSVPTLPPGVTGPTPNNGTGTGNNGETEISGDPHARVNTRGGTPICFNFIGDDHRFVDLLSDANTGFEVNAEIKSLGKVVRLIAVGIKFSVSGQEYRWMADENGISFWINQVIDRTISYGEIVSDSTSHVHFTTFGGGKPGFRVVLNGVAEFQVTFKDKGHKKNDPGVFIEDNHSMGFKTISTDGISHSVSGILGQFIVPNAYSTLEDTSPNFVVFHNRHIPATKLNFHATQHCMQVDNSLVATLLGNSVDHFYVDTLFGTADPARMEDSFLKYVT